MSNLIMYTKSTGTYSKKSRYSLISGFQILFYKMRWQKKIFNEIQNSYLSREKKALSICFHFHPTYLWNTYK